MPLKMEPKSIICSSSFSSRFFFSFGRLFCCFSRSPTLDLIAIYSTFVGCAIFHQVGESTQKDFRKPSKMTPKMQPKASNNASKNEDKKQHEQLTILAPKMDPKWRVKYSGCHPGDIRKRFGNTASFFCGFGMPLDSFWHPFRRLFGILGAFRHPSGCLLAAFGSV